MVLGLVTLIVIVIFYLVYDYGCSQISTNTVILIVILLVLVNLLILT